MYKFKVETKFRLTLFHPFLVVHFGNAFSFVLSSGNGLKEFLPKTSLEFWYALECWWGTLHSRYVIFTVMPTLIPDCPTCITLHVIYGSLASMGCSWRIFSHEHCFVTTWFFILWSIFFIFILTKFPVYTTHTVYLKSIICIIFWKKCKIIEYYRASDVLRGHRAAKFR